MIKKIVILTFLMLLFVQPVFAQDEELSAVKIPNSSFENWQDGVPQNWTPAFQGYPKQTISRSENARKGEFSLKIKTSPLNLVSSSFAINNSLNTPTTYTLKIFAKSANSTASNGVLKLFPATAVGPGKPICDVTLEALPDNWSLHSTSCVINNSQVGNRFYLYLANTSRSPLLLDTISLIQ